MRLRQPLRSAVYVPTLLLICAAVGAAASLTPPAAVKNLAAWYDANDSTTLTLVTPPYVSQWADKSGNGETLTQSSHLEQPIYASTGMKGLAALQFNGAQQLLSSDATFSRLLYPTDTVFIVQSSASDSQNSSSLYSGLSVSQRVNFSLPNYGSCESMGNGAVADCLYYDFGDTSLTNRVNASADANTTIGTHLFMGSGQASVSALLRRDGTSLQALTPVTDTSFSCALAIGARGGCVPDSSFFSGSIGEIVVYNTLLSAANYQRVEGALACKWGLQSQLPTSHPYHSTCPAGSESSNLGAIGGLSAWFDATDSSTLTLVYYVSAMTDKSGHANTLTQSTPASQPYTTVVSGLSALMFSGAQQLLSSSSNTLASGSSPSSMFIVGAFNGTLTGGYAQAASYGAAAGGQSRSVGKSNGTATVDSREYSADVTSTSSWSTSTMLAFATFGASTESLAVNGSTAVSGTDTPNTPASTPFYVGSQGAANPWTGPIYEVLLYNGSLSIVEQQFIEGYLACKWALQGSLPSTHPYKSSCPLTATANLTIALSVSPPGIQVPGTDLTYTNTFTNASGTIVYAPALTATIPANTQFKVGTASQSLGSTGLAAVISYSNDSAATFTYTPASGGGGAAAGYDANVTTVRWSFSGALGPAASIDSGTAAYTVRIK